MFLVRFCRDFVLGFALGKFLDSLGKLAEELAKNNENQIRSARVWGRVGAAENIFKVYQNVRKIIPNIFGNRPLTPPKSIAKQS